MAQCTNISFGLNPLAREFVPISYSSAQANGLNGHPRSSAAEPTSAPAGPDAFEQLPDEARHRADYCAPRVAGQPIIPSH